MANQRGGVEVQGVQQTLHPRNSCSPVTGPRQLRRLAEPLARTLGSEHPDPGQPLEKGPVEQRRSAGTVQDDDGWAIAGLDDVDPSAINVNVSAPQRRRGEDPRVDL